MHRFKNTQGQRERGNQHKAELFVQNLTTVFQLHDNESDRSNSRLSLDKSISNSYFNNIILLSLQLQNDQNCMLVEFVSNYYVRLPLRVKDI